MADVSLALVVAIAAIAGAATGLGALPILLGASISHRTYDGAVGLAAGIMTGAAIFALVLPGMAIGSRWGVATGILLGMAALLVANRYLPHVHLRFAGRHRHRHMALDEASLDARRRAILIGGSITMHNIPEGLAIGSAFASGEEAVGAALAVAIAVQNVPDGFAMAVPADRADLGRFRTLVYTTLSGAIPEPIAAGVGSCS